MTAIYVKMISDNISECFVRKKSTEGRGGSRATWTWENFFKRTEANFAFSHKRTGITKKLCALPGFETWLHQ